MTDELNKRLEEHGLDLPECRTKDRSNPRRLREVFCANCGKSGGTLTGSFVGAAHIYYVCDPCHSRLGNPPGLTPLSPEEANALLL